MWSVVQGSRFWSLKCSYIPQVTYHTHSYGLVLRSLESRCRAEIRMSSNNQRSTFYSSGVLRLSTFPRPTTPAKQILFGFLKISFLGPAVPGERYRGQTGEGFRVRAPPHTGNVSSDMCISVGSWPGVCHGDFCKSPMLAWDTTKDARVLSCPLTPTLLFFLFFFLSSLPRIESYIGIEIRNPFMVASAASSVRSAGARAL